MSKLIKTSRFWYNFKDSLHFYRELFFGTPWDKIKGNENKKKPCLFIRFLDCISRDFEEGGREVEVELQGPIDKFLGLPPEANNAKRFL